MNQNQRQESANKRWRDRFLDADVISGLYGLAGMSYFSDRVKHCSELISFRLDSSGSGMEFESTRFCRARHCPICQWRRSLQWQARAYQSMPKIVDQYPTHKWLVVQLSQKPILISEIRDTLAKMNRAFKRMSERKIFPALGWIKSVIIRKQESKIIPVIQFLSLVPSSYFGHGYIKQSTWVELWRDCLQIDYDPFVSIQGVKTRGNFSSLIPQLVRTCTEELFVPSSSEELAEISNQLYKTRAIARGGILSGFLQESKPSKEPSPYDLIYFKCKNKRNNTGEEMGNESTTN